MEDIRTRMIRLPAQVVAQASLVVMAAAPGDPANRPGRIYPVGSLTRIGRMPTNDVVLHGDAVSREHCVIEHRPDGYYIRDQGSANGTVVGGKKLRDGQLHGKETLWIGDYRLLFWQGDPNDPVLRAMIAALP
jgi:pSer/pThr/pTyr-binding forkhead associated (FHA) protein